MTRLHYMLISAGLSAFGLAALSMNVAAQPAGGHTAGTAPAATQPAVTGVITDQSLRELDDDNFDIREKATSRLIADDSLTPAMVAKAYIRATTAEQKHRLLTVAQHHFIRCAVDKMFSDADPAGALGVSLESVIADESPIANTPGVRITNTFSGFPSFAALKVGDVVFAVDGQKLDDDADNPNNIFNQFRELVKNKTMGKVVALAVSRNGKTLEVKLKMSSTSALLRILVPGQGLLQEPFASAWNEYQRKIEESKAGEILVEPDWKKIRAQMENQPDEDVLVPF